MVKVSIAVFILWKDYMEGCWFSNKCQTFSGNPDKMKWSNDQFEWKLKMANNHYLDRWQTGDGKLKN